MSTTLPTTSTVLSLETTSLFVGRCTPDRIGCGRVVTVGEWISLGIASAAYVFHILMCLFIVCQISAANQLFSSAFYKLYAVLSVVEILHAVLVSCHLKTGQQKSSITQVLGSYSVKFWYKLIKEAYTKKINRL